MHDTYVALSSSNVHLKECESSKGESHKPVKNMLMLHFTAKSNDSVKKCNVDLI